MTKLKKTVKAYGRILNQTRKPEGFPGKKMVNGMFMSRFEALWMELSGSTLLVGRK